jgi:hypothetical protein
MRTHVRMAPARSQAAPSAARTSLRLRACAARPPMAEPESTASTTEQPQGALARLTQLAWQALPAVAGAISLIGFVALIGGAIQWVRFWAAGLPADQAVRAMPEPELVTIGAVSLVSFSIVGVLAVLLLYLLDHRGNATLRTLTGLFGLALAQMFVALCLVDLPTEQNVFLAVVFVTVVGLAYYALANLPRILDDRRAARREDDALMAAGRRYRAAAERYEDALFRAQLPPVPRVSELTASPATPEPPADLEPGLVTSTRQAAVELKRARREWTAAVARWKTVVDDEAETDRRGRAGLTLARGGPPSDEELARCCDPQWDPGKERAEDPQPEGQADEGRPDPGVVERARRSSRGTAGACAGLGMIAGIAYLLVEGGEEERLLAAVLVVVVILTMATFGVAYVTSKFTWYGMAALASLILFGAALNIGRTVRDPVVQPAALVRAGDGQAICGFYVTETDDRVYMSRVQRDEDAEGSGADTGAGRMFWVKKEDVEVLTVGPLQRIPEAQARALALTAEVQADRPDRPGSTFKETVRTTDTSQRRSGIVKTTTTARDVPETDAGEKGESAAAVPAANNRCRTADITEEKVE